MKKLILSVCGVALVGGLTMVGIKKMSAAAESRNVVEKKIVVPQEVVLPLAIEKRALGLPEKVSGKTRRVVSKEMKKHSLNATARALAFTRAVRGKKGAR